MKNIRLIIIAGLKNTFRLKIVWIIMIPVTLICVVGVALLLCLLIIAPEVESATPDRAALEGLLGLILYSSSLISIGITLNSTIFQTLIKEKSRGILAALMATPLKVSDIWIGKSLAIFVPGFIIAVVLTALTWVIVNLIYFVPDIGFIINAQMIINSLVAIPLIYLFFGLLVHLLGFTNKPQTGNIIAQVFLPVMANLGAQLVARGVLDANSWQFMLMNFGIAFIIGIIVLVFKNRLSQEQVILSA